MSDNVTPLRERLSEPCASVLKMRSAETFDRWCFVHHHWLNGDEAESVVDRAIREATDKGAVNE